MSAFDEFEVLMKNVMSRHSSGGTGEMSGGAGEIRDVRTSVRVVGGSADFRTYNFLNTHQKLYVLDM
jgi:N-methylhydantoinase B/oxoprolinase/acetone carboxylase alpha subunit